MNRMKKSIFRTTSALLLLSVATACETKKELPYFPTAIEIVRPADIANLTIESERLTFRNVANGTVTEFTSTAGIELPTGLYECSYEAEVTYVNNPSEGSAGEGNADEGATVKGRLVGGIESMEVTGGNLEFSITTSLVLDNEDFIIEEIFFTGTLRSSGSQYYGDNYIKIYNNTDKVLYADGLAFCESKFTSTQYLAYTPDLRKSAMTVHAIYVVPGSGKEHPVQPGESLVICDTGIDHRNANPNSFDLSNAGFEWYDVSTNPSQTDIDSPTVPNMDKWYSYTQSYFVLHNRGFKSYALARIPIAKEQYLKDYYYSYDYTLVLPSGTFPMTQSAYKLPNEWIVDGVNCSVEAAREWNILPPTVDAGWTYCGKTDGDKTRYFKSVRRKMLYLTADGRRKLKDTNNSTNDFNPECVPSIIELQQSAIDAAGTKATTVTYDGVQPVKQ